MLIPQLLQDTRHTGIVSVSKNHIKSQNKRKLQKFTQIGRSCHSQAMVQMFRCKVLCWRRLVCASCCSGEKWAQESALEPVFRKKVESLVESHGRWVCRSTVQARALGKRSDEAAYPVIPGDR